MKSKNLNDCLEAEPKKSRFVKTKHLLSILGGDKIITPFKNRVDSRKLRHKKGQPVGYKDVKDYLDGFLQYFDKIYSGVTGIVLYGSMARGTGRIDSDIDLLFFTDDEDKTYQKIEQRKGDFSSGEYADLLTRRGLPRVRLSTAMMLNSEFERIVEICRRSGGGPAYNYADDGIVLYDVDGRTKGYLEELRTEPHIKDMIIP